MVVGLGEKSEENWVLWFLQAVGEPHLIEVYSIRQHVEILASRDVVPGRAKCSIGHLQRLESVYRNHFFDMCNKLLCKGISFVSLEIFWKLRRLLRPWKGSDQCSPSVCRHQYLWNPKTDENFCGLLALQPIWSCTEYKRSYHRRFTGKTFKTHKNFILWFDQTFTSKVHERFVAWHGFQGAVNVHANAARLVANDLNKLVVLKNK